MRFLSFLFCELKIITSVLRVTAKNSKVTFTESHTEPALGGQGIIGLLFYFHKYLLHVAHKQAEVQKRKPSCPRSYSEEAGGLGSEASARGSRR